MKFDNKYLEDYGDGFDDDIINETTYGISIDNSTGGALHKNIFRDTKKAILFGYHEYGLVSNYGSENGIKVDVTKSNASSYQEILAKSSFSPFEISKIRILSTNASQLEEVIHIESLDRNGYNYKRGINVRDYINDNQFQTGVVDIPISLIIDGNTNLKFNVLDNCGVTITLFPCKSNNPIQLTVINASEPEIKINKKLLLLR